MDALKSLEKCLICSICLDIYSNPKLLQCNHVFCQACLEKIDVQDLQGDAIIPCPTCRQVTPLPAQGVEKLMTAFHINQFVDIVNEHRDSLSSAEDEQPTTTPVRRPSLVPAEIAAASCFDHTDMKVELHCMECRELICARCTIRGQKHHSHEYEELAATFKKEILSSLEPMENHLEIIKQALENLDTRRKEVSLKQKQIDADIRCTVWKLKEKIDARKEELILQLNELTAAKLKGLAIQKDQLETIQAQFSSCLHFMQESIENDGVMTKKKVVERVRYLSNTFQMDMLKPNTEADMMFLFPATFTDECREFGLVSTLSSPDPAKCYAIGTGTESAFVGQPSTVVVRVLTFNNQPCTDSVSLNFELLSELTGAIAKGSAKRKGHSQYLISYQPTVKGRHLLNVVVNDKQVRGSPFQISARASIRNTTLPILMIENVDHPIGIALTSNGEIVISEGKKHCVSIFKQNGEKIRSFGSQGTGPGQFMSPNGVAVDRKGNILVADRENHRIQIFTSEGHFLTAFGTEGSGPLQFFYPEGIAFNATKTLLYIVDGNEHIQILNSDLSYRGIFGKDGRRDGKFDYPRHVACSSTGGVYVTDFKNHRIQAFNERGSFTRLFGKYGRDEWEFNGPCGVAIGSNERVYITQNEGERVTVFNPEGEFVTSFGGSGRKPGQFRGPTGLAVDHSGVVYVCDYFNKRVQIF